MIYAADVEAVLAVNKVRIGSNYFLLLQRFLTIQASVFLRILINCLDDGGNFFDGVPGAGNGLLGPLLAFKI